MYLWMEGWSLLLDPIHVLPTHFLGTSIASMPVQSSSSSSVPCKPSSLHPSFFIRTHLLVLGQLRSNMSEDMLGTYHVFVVGEFVLVHDRCDGHVDGCTSITVEYNVWTFAQSCLHQGSEKKWKCNPLRFPHHRSDRRWKNWMWWLASMNMADSNLP